MMKGKKKMVIFLFVDDKGKRKFFHRIPAYSPWMGPTTIFASKLKEWNSSFKENELDLFQKKTLQSVKNHLRTIKGGALWISTSIHQAISTNLFTFSEQLIG